MHENLMGQPSNQQDGPDSCFILFFQDVPKQLNPPLLEKRVIVEKVARSPYFGRL